MLRGENDSEGRAQDLLITNNDRTFVSQGAAIEGAWRQDLGWFSQELRFGSRYHFDSVERDHTEDAFEMQSGILVREQPRYSHNHRQPRKNACSCAVYAR